MQQQSIVVRTTSKGLIYPYYEYHTQLLLSWGSIQGLAVQGLGRRAFLVTEFCVFLLAFCRFSAGIKLRA